MNVPPNPPLLEHLGPRPFSFYPPILGVEHNEWLFRKATWAEILVVNTRSQTEVWIPRRFLGEISKVDEPVMIVGLGKELIYKSGQVWAHERRVIEIPKAVNDIPRPLAEEEPPPPTAPPRHLTLEAATENRIGRLIGIALVMGIVATLLIVLIYGGRRIQYTTVLQQDLNLGAQDEYADVVRKMGPPTSDRWRTSGERHYRALSYSKLGLTVILMGVEREKALYVGSVNDDWKPVHTIRLPSRTNSRALLESLPKF